MSEEQLQDFLKHIDDDISYIMDGYYGGLEENIVKRVELKLRSLGAGDKNE